MNLISTTADLEAFCERLKAAEYITVDTEFMREDVLAQAVPCPDRRSRGSRSGRSAG